MRLLLSLVALLLLLPAVAAAPSVSLQYPSGGENITANATITAQWSASEVNHFVLSWTRDTTLSCASGNWMQLESDYFPTTFNWVLPTISTTTARFRVQGVDENDAVLASACSGEFSIYLPPSLQPPAAPTGLSATILTPFRVRVSWNAASGATLYSLYRNAQFVANTTTPTYTDSVSPSSSLSYTVLAWNSNGASAASSAATVTTPSASTGPAVVEFSPTANLSSLLGTELSFSATLTQEATVTWTVNSATARVDSNVSESTLTLNATSLGTGAHLVRMTATNEAGSSSVAWRWTVIAPTPGACRVDATGLAVSGDTIRVQVRNNGQLSTQVNATLAAKGVALQSLLLSLGPGETRNVTAGYSFPIGTTRVTIDLNALCGSTDRETLDHVIFEGYACTNPTADAGANRCDYINREYLECSGSTWVVRARNETQYCYNCGPKICGDGACNCGEDTSICPRDCPAPRIGYTGETRCLDREILEKEYRHPNGTVVWLEAETCTYGCFSGECKNATQGTEPGCHLSLERFEYQNPVTPGQLARATLAARNTGSQLTRVNLTLLVNGAQAGFWTDLLVSGATLSKDFFYAPPASSFSIQARTASNCGASATRSASISTTTGGGGGTIQPLPLPPIDTGPGPIERTEVSFFPSTLDIPAFKTKVIAVRLRSKQPQPFSIAVSGVPEQWLSYESRVTVNREETVYVFVTPTEPGNHTIQLSATAEQEQLRFPAEAQLYASPSLPTSTGIVQFDQLLASAQSALAAAQASPFGMVGILVLAFILVIALGAFFLRIELW